MVMADVCDAMGGERGGLAGSWVKLTILTPFRETDMTRSVFWFASAINMHQCSICFMEACQTYGLLDGNHSTRKMNNSSLFSRCLSKKLQVI